MCCRLPYPIHSAADGLVVKNHMYLLRQATTKIIVLRVDLEKEGDNCEEMAALDGLRASSSIATDGHSFIYISGGYIPDIQNPMSNETKISSVDRYDITQNKWERNWSKMPTPRYDHSSIVMNGCLYVFGGRNEVYDLEEATLDCSDPTQQVPICNLKTRVWIYGSPMPTPNANFTVVPWEGRFIIPFSSGGNCTLVYDSLNDRWNFSTICQKFSSVRVDPKYCLLPDGKVALLGGAKPLGEPPNWCDSVTSVDINEIIKSCELDWNRR